MSPVLFLVHTNISSFSRTHLTHSPTHTRSITPHANEQVLAALIYLAVKCVRRDRGLRRARREQVRLQRATLLEAAKGTSKLNFPFHLIRGSDFIKHGALVQHEALRDQGRLIVIDGLDEAYVFAANRPIVFFSHQWTAFGVPDHTSGQYEAMCAALRTLCDAKGWQLNAVCCWVDFGCIPQRHGGLQALAIQVRRGIESWPIHRSIVFLEK